MTGKFTQDQTSHLHFKAKKWESYWNIKLLNSFTDSEEKLIVFMKLNLLFQTPVLLSETSALTLDNL